jgi:predicted  nucleic acid-binding Zn-ribbon protein
VRRRELPLAEDALREEITRLMSLQAIDRELRELQQALTTVSGRSLQLRQEALDYAAELERLQLEDQQSVVARRNLEKELAENEARQRSKRMRSNQVRNDRESLAVDHEIESLKETKQRIESELLVMMEAAEQRTARIKVLIELSEQRRIELIEAEKETAAQVEDLKISISKQHVDRDLMTKNIDVALLQRYEIIFSRRAGVAVTEAKGGTCQGCRMRLPPQLYNEIQKHLQVHFCPNCQRILYFEAIAKI